ncbi:unnamed protein product [Gordionus sp. m RMFG-2023]
MKFNFKEIQQVSGVFLVAFWGTSFIQTQLVNPTVESKEVTDANWKIAIDLYKKLAETFKEKSIFFSPQCVTTSLMLLHAGARGETATQIFAALGFPNEINHKHHDAQDMLFKNISNDSRNMFSLVKALFLQEGLKVEPEFQNIATQYYQAKIEMMDFSKDPKESREMANKWIATQTKSQIMNLIFKDVTIYTKFILASAMEFQAKWNRLISPKYTTLKVFNGISGPTKPIPMMTFSGNMFYFVDPLSKAQVIEVPYLGDNVGAYVILPSAGSSIMDLENRLAAMGTRAMLTNLSPMNNVKVILPKLAFNLTYDLAPQLKDMGMTYMFDKNKANFSGMVSGPWLPLDNFYHQSRTNFQDEGYLLGPDIMVPQGPLNIPPQIFEANRPFLFCVISKMTQVPLFIGRYMGE